VEKREGGIPITKGNHPPPEAKQEGNPSRKGHQKKAAHNAAGVKTQNWGRNKWGTGMATKGLELKKKKKGGGRWTCPGREDHEATNQKGQGNLA